MVEKKENVGRDWGDAHTLSELEIVTLDSWILILAIYPPASHLCFVHVQNGMVPKKKKSVYAPWSFSQENRNRLYRMLDLLKDTCGGEWTAIGFRGG